MIRTDKRRKKERTKKETSDILRYERERDREWETELLTAIKKQEKKRREREREQKGWNNLKKW